MAFFGGGARYQLGQPGGPLGGGLAPDPSRVSRPDAGVAPTEIKRARHNSGTNVRIPYARVVPGKRLVGPALPTLREKDHFDYRLKTGPKKYKDVEHESQSLAVGDVVFVRGHGKRWSDNDGESYTGIADVKDDLSLDAPLRVNSGTGVDKLSRLCGVEYLKRYYETVHWSTEVQLPAGIVAGPSPFLRYPTDSDAQTTFGQILHLEGEEQFRKLTMRMNSAGLLTWKPDGIVVGKDHVDEQMDDTFDDRLGQLLNIAIQGPGTTTSYCNDSNLLCLPNDVVFVLLVCDLADGQYGEGDVRNPSLEAAKRKARDYAATMSDEVNKNARAQAGLDGYREAVLGLLRGDDDSAWLRNFRVMLSTSSHMLRRSGFSPGAGNTKDFDGDRLGLRPDQYVVGGWSIGHVLDSAATRPYTGMYNPTQDPLTSSLNVFVCVKWWDGGRLHNAFYTSRGSARNVYDTSLMDWEDINQLHRDRWKLIESFNDEFVRDNMIKIQELFKTYKNRVSNPNEADDPTNSIFAWWARQVYEASDSVLYARCLKEYADVEGRTRCRMITNTARTSLHMAIIAHMQSGGEPNMLEELKDAVSAVSTMCMDENFVGRLQGI